MHPEGTPLKHVSFLYHCTDEITGSTDSTWVELIATEPDRKDMIGECASAKLVE